MTVNVISNVLLHLLQKSYFVLETWSSGEWVPTCERDFFGIGRFESEINDGRFNEDWLRSVFDIQCKFSEGTNRVIMKKSGSQWRRVVQNPSRLPYKTP